MLVTITEEEFEAINSAQDNIYTQLEGCDEEELHADFRHIIKNLGSVMEKYKIAREKNETFKRVRKQVVGLGMNLCRRDIDIITRKYIKENIKTNNDENN